MSELLQFPQSADFGARFSECVLHRLWQARDDEENVHLLDDLVVAWHAVSLAAQGSPAPFVEACYKVLSCHPDLVFQKITAWRKAKLGTEYSRCFDDAGNLRPNHFDIPDYDPEAGFLPLRPLVRESSKTVRVKWPKEPLRVIVSRTEIREGERVLYHVEQLECGHSHTEFLDANPGALRRRCPACRDGIQANAQQGSSPVEEPNTLRILSA